MKTLTCFLTVPKVLTFVLTMLSRYETSIKFETIKKINVLFLKKVWLSTFYFECLPNKHIVNRSLKLIEKFYIFIILREIIKKLSTEF